MNHFPSPTSSSHHGPGSVLIIENDQMVCDAMNDILSDSGYRVYIAHDGIEGEKMYRSLINDIDIIIIDWRLPRQDGRDTLRKIRQVNPNVQVMVASGYAEEDVTRQLTDVLPFTFLGKPFNMSNLLNKVEKMMA